jgi:hypothetical protein
VPTLKGAANAASAAIFAAMVGDLGGLCSVVPDPQMGIVPRLVSKPLSSGVSPDVLRWSPVRLSKSAASGGAKRGLSAFAKKTYSSFATSLRLSYCSTPDRDRREHFGHLVMHTRVGSV